jgi:hypothetical protein
MKATLVVLLFMTASTFAMTSFAAEESVTVTGSRIPGGGGTGGVHFPSSGRPGGAAGRFSKVDPCQRGPSDCGGPTVPNQELSNAQLAELALTQIGSLVTTLRDATAYAYLEVIVTTPDGLKVEVRLELGYGKVNVVSRKKVPQ